MSRSLYFCLPPNDKLLAYWDTVADRLFKVRHCMNLEGVLRQLALFDPPIDPALLVAAARRAGTSAACSATSARRCRTTASASRSSARWRRAPTCAR